MGILLITQRYGGQFSLEGIKRPKIKKVGNMIIAKYIFNKECIILERGDSISMLTKYYDIVTEHDDGDYIISLDHRPNLLAVEYANIKGENPGFVLVLSDVILDAMYIKNNINKSDY
jgi:hypothetical protein